MALSNWDSCAINTEGKPISAIFTYENITVELYKNWIYVFEKGKEKHIASIQSGDLIIGDVHIYAIRGPQEGIYATIWSGQEYNNTIDGVLMIGVYGFENEKWVGIKESSLKWFKNKLNLINEEHDEFDYNVPEKIRESFKIENMLHYNQGDAFFANAFNVEIPAFEVGKVEKPLILQGLGEEKNVV